jgi:hypothetical protein
MAKYPVKKERRLEYSRFIAKALPERPEGRLHTVIFVVQYRSVNSTVFSMSTDFFSLGFSKRQSMISLLSSLFNASRALATELERDEEEEVAISISLAVAVDVVDRSR